MRKFIVAVVIAVVAVLGGIAVPASASVHGTSVGATCTANYKWKTGTTDGIMSATRWGEAQWTSNPCSPPQLLQTRINCHNVITGSPYSVTSGQVKAVGLWAKASCSTNDVAVNFQIRFNPGNGWGSYRTLCVQNGNPNCNWT